MKIKLNYKIVSILLLIICVVLLYFCRNDGWDSYIKTILISLSINLISSIIIIFVIDGLIKKNNVIETRRLRKMALSRLVISIKRFDDLIIKMYKESLKDNKEVSCNYDEKNVTNIINNINLLNSHERGIKVNLSNIEAMSWQTIIVDNIIFYLSDIENFYNNNSYLFDSEIASIFNEILNYLNVVNICKNILKYNAQMNMSDLTKVLQLEKILLFNFSLRNTITEYVDNANFKTIIE